ncbi:MAG: hypothetical protein DI538_01920 [Azospira oryzae]|jgi:hypothetical protein|nr:hypothetical protein [Cytophaga sp.]PZR41237.1 MAG: hypothetical protein DI538_01920 [Azospira oryzae]
MACGKAAKIEYDCIPIRFLVIRFIKSSYFEIDKSLKISAHMTPKTHNPNESLKLLGFFEPTLVN